MKFFNRVSNAFNAFTGAVGAAIAPVGYKYFRLGTATVTPQTAYRSSVYSRCVAMISGQCGKLVYGIFDKDRNQMYEKLHYLLNTSPDGERTAVDFKTLAFKTAIDQGNFYAQIVRNVIDQPIKLIFIESSRVTPRRNGLDELVYDVTGVGPKAVNITLDARNMFHVKGLHLTEDGLMGIGAVTYGRDVLGINMSLTNTVLNFFRNVSLPIGVILTKGKYDEVAESRMKRTFNKDEDDGNSDAPGGLAVLDQSFEYKLMDYKEDPLQFINSRKWSKLEIATFLGVNPAFVYEIEVLKTAKMQELELALYKDCLSIWIAKFEAEVNLKLLNYNYADKFCKADVDPLLLEDRRAMAEYDTKQHQMGVFNADTIRAKRHNLPAAPGGDRYYIAANNLKPVDRLDDIIDADIERSKPQQPKDVTPPQDQIQNAVNQALTKVLIGGSNNG